MLLERERKRLLGVLQSRTASHGERTRARKMLEDDLSPSDQHPERESSAAQNGDRRPDKSSEGG